MSESKNYFLFEFLVLLCCISFQNVSGVKVELTRSEGGDYFTNPYSMSADDDGDKFCLSTNAICFKDYPKIGYKCRYCKCDKVKTFNETSLRCASIQDFGQGCRTKFNDDSIKLLDLTKDGVAVLYAYIANLDVNSVRIISMNGIKVDFFEIKIIRVSKDAYGRWDFKIEWRNVPKQTYNGQVFRVQISYKVGEILGIYSKNYRGDCFVFKSKGTISVTIPDLTTTSPLPSTNEKLTIQTSPSHTVLPITETIPTLATTPPLPSATAPLLKTKPGPTNETRKKESSGGGKNAIILSLAVVGCLLFLGVVILAVLWCREGSARLSQDKKNTEISLANGKVENPMMMSQVESSQKEAGNSVEVGEVDHEYYNAEGDVENYASLDVTKVERKPIYESLINVGGDLYENIPSKEKTGNDNPERISNMP